jgi:hypothetical protein
MADGAFPMQGMRVNRQAVTPAHEFGNSSSDLADAVAAFFFEAAAVGPVDGVATQNVTPTQVATGTLALAATATQDATPFQVVTGGFALTGAAAQDVTPAQTATGALALAAIATQSVTPSQIATGALAIAGVAVQSVTPSQAATGALALAGTATQDATPAQTATGSFVLAAAAVQDATPSQAATGALALAGTVSQDITPSQAATGALALSGAASQDVTPAQVAEGEVIDTSGGVVAQDITPAQTATATLAIAASATQSATPTQAAAGTLAITGSATQAVIITQSAAGLDPGAIPLPVVQPFGRPNLFGANIAQELYSALGRSVLAATLTRVTAGSRGDITAGRVTGEASATYPCRGWCEEFNAREIDGTVVRKGDRKIAILGKSLPDAIDPQPGDVIVIEGRAWKVVTPSKRDPAGAVFICAGRN